MIDTADILKQQRAWLDKLQDRSKKPILIKAIEGKTPENGNSRLYNWMPYKDVWNDVKQPIYTRSILANELLLDPDVKDWNTLARELNKISNFCKRENIPLQLGYSGGNGIHGDIFFDEIGIDSDNFDDCKRYDIDLYKAVRNALVEIILEGSGTTKQALQLDPKKINFSMNRMGSMVREYGTLRPDGNYKTLINEIPNTKPTPGSLPLIFPDTIELWKVPEKYNKRINDRIREEIERATEYNNYNLDTIDLAGNELTKFPCLKKLFKIGASSGKRYYGATSITLMAKKCGYAWKATEESIRKFFENCEITESEAQIRIDNVKPMFETTDHNFSCRAVKETFGFDICEFPKCPLCQKIEKIKKAEVAEDKEQINENIKKAALEIAEHGDPLDFILNTHQSIHVGDNPNLTETQIL